MITGVVLVKNEEENIARCLDSLAFCDEILLIDNHSTDRTLKIASKYTKKIYSTKSTSFAEMRNLAMKKVTKGWILFIDADEIVTKKLKEEIVLTLNNPKAQAYALPRTDIFWGKAVRWGEVLSARTNGIVRLVKRGSGIWVGDVHEVFELSKGGNGEQRRGSVKKLKNPIIHYSHAGIADFLESINTFSTIRAEELYKQGVTAHFFSLTLRPWSKFFYTYILKLGFLDGARGFVYSFMLSFHAFLVRAKLYLLCNKR